MCCIILYVFLIFNYWSPLMVNIFILQENTHIALSETIWRQKMYK